MQVLSLEDVMRAHRELQIAELERGYVVCRNANDLAKVTTPENAERVQQLVEDGSILFHDSVPNGTMYVARPHAFFTEAPRLQLEV
jgi:hypothetical protein